MRLADFRIVYYGAKALVQHKDLYDEVQSMQVYLTESGDQSQNPKELHEIRRIVGFQVNLPTMYLFQLLPWRCLHLLLHRRFGLF